MSNIPPPDPPNNLKPIPKEAMKFLKLSPSVKVMSLKKSSTTCRVKASQAAVAINSSAEGSVRPPTTSAGSESTDIPLRPMQKEKKKISVFSSKSGKEVRQQLLEKRGIGDEKISRKDVENIYLESGPGGSQKHWYGRWMEALLSAKK